MVPKLFSSKAAIVASLLFVSVMVGVTSCSPPAPPPDDGAIPASWPGICGDNIAEAGTPLVAGETNCRGIGAGGLTRRFVAYVPAEAASAEVPVVFMFHGSGGTGEEFYERSGWREVAEAEGFIAVFPTGRTYHLLDGKTQTKWHSFSLVCDAEPRPASWPGGAAYPADDESLVDAILADLASSSRVDADRLYASGFSNGSAFAQRLAVTRADTFAAIGSWAGGVNGCEGDDGEPVEPIVAPHARIPATSAVPVALGLGNEDDKYLAGINEALVAGGESPIPAIPLDQPSIERYLGHMLARETAAMGLATVSGTPIEVTDRAGVAWLAGWNPPVYTTLQWDDPVAGNTSANTFTFMLLDGVQHVYPRAVPGDPGLILRSGSVNAAWMFWQFFERHTGT